VLLFNEVIEKRFEHDGEETVKIFSKHITKMIAQAYKDSPDELSFVLKETIAESIALEIENNKDTMVDSLYPIMGGLVSKYVSQAIKELMQNINTKIDDGLSIDTYKRKIKSKMTGVSETELLIQEGGQAIISSLFVIQKESGLLIAEAQLQDKEVQDPHMVASMASAIKDFINDWVNKNETQNEVQILSYGASTLYIESAGSVYVVAFLDKDPEYELRNKINAFFASIVDEYASFFRIFDGDDSAKDIVRISAKMQEYLALQQLKIKPYKKQNYAKYVLYGLLCVYFIYLGYRGIVFYRESSLENKIMEQTGQQVNVHYENKHITLDGHVSNIAQLNQIETIAIEEEKYPIYNYLSVSQKYLIDTQIQRLHTKLMLLSKTSKIKDKELMLQNKTLNIRLKKTNNIINTIKQNLLIETQFFEQKRDAMKNKIASHLEKVFEESPFYKVTYQSLGFQDLNLFLAGHSKYNIKAMKVLQNNFEKYMEVLESYSPYIERIVIEGHSDSRGEESANITLSKKRALEVRSALLQTKTIKMYNMQSLLEIEVFGSQDIIKENGVENPSASRRIEIRFELKNNKVLEKLNKIIIK
jgi:outer membrane protein OmpA-like peptidoglycan-associated protein